MDGPKTFERPLTGKLELFARAYVETRDLMRAYEQAGYSMDSNAKTRAREATKKFARADVKQRIEELEARAMQRHDVTVDRIINELAIMAFARFDAFHDIAPDGTPRLNLNKLADSPELFAAIGQVKVKTFVERNGEEFEEVKEVELKMNDKLQPLLNLGKHLGMFKERHVHEGTLELKNAAEAFTRKLTGFCDELSDEASDVLH